MPPETTNARKCGWSSRKFWSSLCVFIVNKSGRYHPLAALTENNSYHCATCLCPCKLFFFSARQVLKSAFGRFAHPAHGGEEAETRVDNVPAAWHTENLASEKHVTINQLDLWAYQHRQFEILACFIKYNVIIFWLNWPADLFREVCLSGKSRSKHLLTLKFTHCYHGHDSLFWAVNLLTICKVFHHTNDTFNKKRNYDWISCVIRVLVFRLFIRSLSIINQLHEDEVVQICLNLEYLSHFI